MRRRRATLSLPVNGEVVVVPLSPHLHCPKCGEEVLGFKEAARLQARAFKIYRARLGLLSAAEIHALRARLHLTQGALAGLLRLGANTISRWETGRNVQTAAMDVLLRLVRDVPASLLYLQRTRQPREARRA
jgi:putative zinc finger/helix-turn-helix YgiT family protein